MDNPQTMHELSEIKNSLGKHIATTEILILKMTETMEMHAKDLYGRGTEDSPGLLKDVDRLKQTELTRKTILGITFTGVVGLALERISQLFIRHT